MKPPVLSSARLVVLGCGSVGSWAALFCASSGVGHVVLADRERLETDNLRRHLCDERALGRPKAEAVARALGQRCPGVATAAHTFCLLEEPARLRTLLAEADVALAAVDSEAAKHLIDALARELGRPVVYAGVYGDGWGVEALRCDPGLGSPCYACTARALGRVGVPLDPFPAAPA